ncbi:Bicupin, oxalate decarboxylase/oxidase [Tirmania nivea]|nr:Bicupin, oxalate decarboxylase/oxidase [Tirmania nivea]
MKTVTRLLTLIFALTIALLAGLEASRVNANANTNGQNDGNIPVGVRATKHLRPVIESPKFYEQDPRNPVREVKDGNTVQIPRKGDNAPGGPILGGTNPQIDAQNPSQLTPPPTDNGAVVNLKWSLSLSNRKLVDGGWVREQLVTDLPPSKDIAAAQVHLKKGAIRELHWHRVAEWGMVLNGSIIVSTVNETGESNVFEAKQWDMWYFPKGVSHTLQGVQDAGNEFLLCFDDGNFEALGTTFHIVDWLVHAPPEVLAKNFGVDKSVFDKLPPKNPYVQSGKVTNSTRALVKNESKYLYSAPMIKDWANNTAGEWLIVDKTNFPILNSLAATVVILRPGKMRELHWNTNGDEWIYFHSGKGRATVYMGSTLARTFDFEPGDTAVFPDNAAHYIENTGKVDLVWVEVFKDNMIKDVSLSQWLAFTPPDLVADILNVTSDFVEYVATNFTKKRFLV